MPNFDLRSCRIVPPKDATPGERHAAEELRLWIGKLVGTPPEIVPEKEGRCIILRTSSTLGPEAFSILPKKADLVVSGGRPRGVLYGVYELLDRFAGIRWLAYDETIIPGARTELSLPSKGFSFSPVLAYREPFFTEAFDGDWAARNRMNSHFARLTETHGGKLTYEGFVHTFNLLVPPGEYFASHPEYFSEVGGRRTGEKAQLCLTNPDVVRIAAERVISWFKKNPNANIVSVSQNDWGNACQCPKCSKVDEQEGSKAGSLLSFVNQVAEIVEKEFPDRWIDTLAYQYTRKAPKSIGPRRNVVVRLCSIECCFSHPLATCPENDSFKRDTQDWARVAHTLYVWDYVTDFAHYIMPFPNLRVLQPNILFFVKNRVKGIFEEGSYPPGGGGEFASLRSYVLSRILWEPGCDAQAAMEEFTSGYYGPAAGTVRSYIELLHDRVEKGRIHVRIFDKPDRFLDAPFVDECLSLFDEAEEQAVEERHRRRVKLSRLPLTYSKVFLMDRSNPARKALLKDFVQECRAFGISNISEGKTLDRYAEESLV